MIRIIVADDHALVRAGFCRLLEAESDMEVLGEADGGYEAIKMCKDLCPHVLLLDFDMPDIDGFDVTREIVAARLGTKILILTMHSNNEYAVRLIQAGACGFIAKGSSTDELLKAIRKVASGKTYITPAIMETITFHQFKSDDANPVSLLSERELQVLIRLARGKVNREISSDLCVSPGTVETYRRRIFEKLQLRNLADLTRFAIRYDLIDKY